MSRFYEEMMITMDDTGILADDLTGACDVAACFTPVAGPVGVRLSPDGPFVGGSAFHVINTQSRLEDPKKAYNILYRVGTTLAGKRIVFKKIDTGLRGPIGAELAGLIEGVSVSGHAWSFVVAPAAPSIGRTTRDGVQYENGIPIDQGAFAVDPHMPPFSAEIRTTIEQTGSGGYLVCDAENQEDLQRIVDTSLQKARIIFVGSLGLAEALASRLGTAPCYPPRIAPAKRPMLVCGSCHLQSIRQTQQAQTGEIQILDFDPARQCFQQVIPSEGKPTMLVRMLPRLSADVACSPRQIMASFLATLDPLLKKIKPDGLGVIGGETAYHLLQHLGVKNVEVYQRRAEVIACARIIGGVMDGCRLVCKGGSVGPDDSVLQMRSLLTSADYGE
jgi:D-threonate/D-erythronate kinase